MWAALTKILLPVPAAVIPYTFCYQCTHTTDPQQMRKYQIRHQQICFSSSKINQNPFSARAVPRTPLGELTMLPQAPSRLGRSLRSEFKVSREKGRAIPPPPRTPLGELTMLPQAPSRLGRSLRSEFEVSREKGRAIPPSPFLSPFLLWLLAFQAPRHKLLAMPGAHTDQNFNTKSSTNPIQKHVNTSITAI